MLKQRDQFDISRAQATAATPTCCCCCCCCVTTIATSTILPTRMVEFQAKKRNNPKLKYLMIATYGLWPISLLVGLIVGVLYNYMRTQHLRKKSGYRGKLVYIEKPNFWLFGLNHFPVGVWTSLFIFTTLLFVVFYFLQGCRAFLTVPAIISVCCIGLIFDTIFGLAIFLPSAQLFDLVFGNTVSLSFRERCYLASVSPLELSLKNLKSD